MDIQTSNVNCAFCGAGNRKVIDSEGEWNVVKCKNCDFIYTYPQPDEASLPYFYTEEYFKDKRHYKKFYNEDGSLKQQTEDYTNRIFDVESYVNSRGKVVEIGSARGGFLSVLKSRGWTVEGVEISSDAAAIANDKGIQTYNGVFANFQPDESPDVICLYQTLEHLPDPKEVISHAHKILNKEGLFIAEIPNIKCFEMKYNKERKHLSYDLPRHLNHFSPKFLQKKLEEAGFKVLDINLYPPAFLLKLLSKRSRSKQDVAKKSDDQKPNFDSNIPLARKQKAGVKFKIINAISRVFPGWRFTITAQK